MQDLKERFDKLVKRVDGKIEEFRLLRDIVNVEAESPEMLSDKGIKTLNILDDMVSLYKDAVQLSKDARDWIRKEEALFQIAKHMKEQKESKYKITDATLNRFSNADDEIFEKKILVNQIEAEEKRIEQEIINMREFINLLKKGVEAKKNLERDYQKISL